MNRALKLSIDQTKSMLYEEFVSYKLDTSERPGETELVFIDLLI